MHITNEKIRLRLESFDGKKRRRPTRLGILPTLCVIYTAVSLVIKLMVFFGIVK